MFSVSRPQFDIYGNYRNSHNIEISDVVSTGRIFLFQVESPAEIFSNVNFMRQ